MCSHFPSSGVYVEVIIVIVIVVGESFLAFQSTQVCPESTVHRFHTSYDAELPLNNSKVCRCALALTMAMGTLRVGQWRGSPGQALKDMSGLGSEAIVRHFWKMADRAMSKSNKRAAEWGTK